MFIFLHYLLNESKYIIHYFSKNTSKKISDQLNFFTISLKDVGVFLNLFFFNKKWANTIL